MLVSNPITNLTEEKTMKKLLLSGLVLATLAFGSCQRFLEIRQPDVTPYDQALNDVANVEAVLRAVYSDLQAYPEFIRIHTYYGDEGDLSRLSQDQFASDFLTRQFGRFNGIGESLWTIGYSAIYRSNQVLDATTTNKYNASDAVKTRIKGECHFVRGFYHFELCRTFALPPSAGLNRPGVVLRTSAPAGAGQTEVKPRATVQEVYSFAISELRQAINDLPEVAPIGRLNKDAARAALLRVYFNMLVDGDASAAQNVKDLADQLVASGKYKITAPWKTFSFDPARRGITAPDSAVIAQLVNTLSDDGGGALSGAFWGNTPDNVFVPILTGPGSLHTALRNHGGLRYDTLVLNKNGTRPYTAKYAGISGAPNKNLNLFRYAEVLLSRAEANLALNGDINASLADLNQVRAAANVPLASTLDRGLLLDSIRLERRLELHLEGDRFHELRRLKSANIRGRAYDDSKAILQIPNSESRANPNIELN